MKKVIAIVLALVLVLGLAACAAKTEAPKAEAPKAEEPAKEETPKAEEPAKEETPKEEAPAAQKSASDLTVAFMTHVENQWGTQVTQGATKAAKEKGVKLLVGNYNQDNAKMVELLDTYRAQNVDGILCGPSDQTIELLNNIAADGIAIGCYNLYLEGINSLVAVSYSQYDLGAACTETALQLIEERLNGEPHVGIIGVAQGSTISDDRDNGFFDGIKAKYPDATIENYNWTMTPEEGLRMATDMLTANPDLNIIFGGCEAGVIGAVNAVRNLGLEGKVFVFGVDATEQMCNMLLDDDEVLWALGGQDATQMAYFAMSKLIDRILGVDTDYEVGEFTAMEVPQLNRNNKDVVEAFIASLQEYK